MFNTVKASMYEMLKYSQKEYATYKKEGKTIHLQQAGEKLFNAFGRYLEVKYNRRSYSHNDLYDMAKANASDFRTLEKLEDLHEFFYAIDKYAPDIVNRKFSSVVKTVKEKIERL